MEPQDLFDGEGVVKIAAKVYSFSISVQDSILCMLDDGEFHPLILELKPSDWSSYSVLSKQVLTECVRSTVQQYTYATRLKNPTQNSLQYRCPYAKSCPKR